MSARIDPRAVWACRVGPHESYQVMSRGGLYWSRRGGWQRVLSFCLGDGDQGPVVALPIVSRVSS